MRKDQTPRLPPTNDGDADISKACRSLKGCGRNLDTQSIEFFKCPGIEPLYSGEQIMKASLARSLFLNSFAPSGILPFASRSWLNDGQSNSCILAKSTVAPFCSRTFLASRTNRPFNDSVLKEAEKIKTCNGSRPDIGNLSFIFVNLLPIKYRDATASRHPAHDTNSQ